MLNGNLESESSHYYREQLENIPIHFISTHYYSDGEEEKSGLPDVKKALNRALSNSARFLSIIHILNGCIERVIKRTRAIFVDRFDAIENDFDEAEVQGKLDEIRNCLLSELESFKKKLDRPLNEMKRALDNFADSHKDAYLYGIEQDARRVIVDCCRVDVSKHWATRRAGNWGSDISSYRSLFGQKVANKIFPRVDDILGKYVKFINEYAEAVKLDLNSLQVAIASIEEKNALSGVKPLTLLDCLSRLDFEDEVGEFIESSKISIMQNLDSFSQAAREKLDSAKGEVRFIEGKGTSHRQTEAVNNYYEEIEGILSNALNEHLELELENFSTSLLSLAESVKPRVERSLTSELDNKVSAISNSLIVMNEAKKEETINYLVEVIDWCDMKKRYLEESDFDEVLISN